MDDRPEFRRPSGPIPRNPRKEAAMVTLLLLVGAMLLARPLWEPGPPAGTLVEVQGDVPNPGMHVITPPTLPAALVAAGATAVGHPATLLHQGDRVIVHGDDVEIAGASDPLLVGLPVNLNDSDERSLAAIPGIGRATAKAIVENRERRGLFYAVSDLSRVRGLGPRTVSELAPLLTVGDVGPRPPRKPLNINEATVAQLDALPGIGPVLAARILINRTDEGPFSDVDDLQRVDGIGPAKVDGLRERVVAE